MWHAAGQNGEDLSQAHGVTFAQEVTCGLEVSVDVESSRDGNDRLSEPTALRASVKH